MWLFQSKWAVLIPSEDNEEKGEGKNRARKSPGKASQDYQTAQAIDGQRQRKAKARKPKIV